MSSLVKPGRYDAIVKEFGNTKTKDGLPQKAVRFEFEYEDSTRELLWFGSFKGGALPFTIKALLACGLQGNNPAGPLTIGQEVSIVVEVDKDNDGKERNKVAWVNARGGIGETMEDVEASSLMEQFSGAVMAARGSSGQTQRKVRNEAPGVDQHPFAPRSKEPWD